MHQQRNWESGYSSSSYDKYVQEQSGNKKSVANRMQQQYWVTKQSMIKKLGRKEDEHVIAGDSELDSKLEVFKSIQNTCMEMLRIIEKYQDNLCALSQEEGGMGRFLKQCSSVDKTRAGKMMAAVGKAQTSSSEQRLALRPPLARLYQEIETFRYRAISDTLMTINRMEGARLEYRAALLWMKDISKELDPDTYKQLEKFRKVQAQVRSTKARFEKLKNDVCQKVDLLGASRCNLFSHTLASYQNTLLHFWEKTSRTMAAVQEGFRGYQHYEFNMLKDLTQTSKQLAEETNPKTASRTDLDEAQEVKEEREAVRQRLISLGEDSERHIDQGGSLDARNNGVHDPMRQQGANNLLGDDIEPSERERTAFMSLIGGQEGSDREEFDDIEPSERERTAFMSLFGGQEGSDREEFGAYTSADLLSGDLPTPDDMKDEMDLLNEILNTPSGIPSELLTPMEGAGPGEMEGVPTSSADQGMGGFMPSDLLEITSMMSEMPTGSPATTPQGGREGGMPAPPQYSDLFADRMKAQQTAGAQSNKSDSSKPQAFKKGQKTDMSAWFNLFADLDPLANPDDIGHEEGKEVEDRNC